MYATPALAEAALLQFLGAVLALALALALAQWRGWGRVWRCLNRPVARPRLTPPPPPVWWGAAVAEWRYRTARPRRRLRECLAARRRAAIARLLERLPYFDNGLTRREYECLALAALPPGHNRLAMRKALAAGRDSGAARMSAALRQNVNPEDLAAARRILATTTPLPQ